MPNLPSAAKRMVTSRIKRTANRSSKGRLANVRAELLAALAAGDKTKAQELLRTYFSYLDKAAKQGVIKSNNANRHKARAAALLK
ncbi:MAG: 30S ribosomal protein S20 [Verrucomicrobia bacterium]|nr:30S ribosomal protein S20 [Verrucomicrobiota bacterium]